jgi:SMODS and SLOG-associating 2TM effector domain family 5
MTTSNPSPLECFDKLLCQVRITSKARYRAAQRLSIHGWCTQWTLAFLAMGQIAIALLIALDLHRHCRVQYMHFGAVFFGGMVLAYSLLLGMANFTARAVLMHKCALELGHLARRLLYIKETTTGTKYEYDAFVKEYAQILEKHENHSQTDYLSAHIVDQKKESAAKQQRVTITLLVLLGSRLKFYFYNTLQFCHYIFTTLLISCWILNCVL